MKRSGIAIPISSKSAPGRATIGTGFLGAYAGRTHLVTCAHVPLNRHPTREWDKWPKEIQLHLGSKMLTTPLFEQVGMHRKPLFGSMPRGPGDPRLHDTIYIPLDDLPLGRRKEVIAAHRIFSLEGRSEPAESTAITGHGFPQVGTHWPTPQPSRSSGSVISSSMGMIRADVRATPGYSGGPVTDPDGDLVGMIIGHVGDPKTTPALIASKWAICAVIDPAAELRRRGIL